MITQCCNTGYQEAAASSVVVVVVAESGLFLLLKRVSYLSCPIYFALIVPKNQISGTRDDKKGTRVQALDLYSVVK